MSSNKIKQQFQIGFPNTPPHLPLVRLTNSPALKSCYWLSVAMAGNVLIAL